MKKALFSLVVLGLFLSACGAGTPTEEPTPVLTGEDVQATAVSMAWTMAAQTMEAMPTATFTPVPPTATFTPVFTETPLPTMTPVFTETPLHTATPEPTATSATEIKFLSSWSGQSTSFLIENQTKASATVSIYLVEGTNAMGYYGSLPGAYLEKNQSTVVSAPVQGTYCFWAWMSSTSKNWSMNGCFGTNNPDKNRVRLTESGIRFDTP